MDNQQKRDMFITSLLRNIAAIFTLSLLPIITTGIIITHFDTSIQTSSMLFNFAPAGIAYYTVLQIAGFSVVLAIFSTILFSENIFKKIRFIWRIIFLFIATILCFSVFGLIFKWLPVNEPLTWFLFLFFSIFCFIPSIGLTILKLKFERKKYAKLLANYKIKKSTVS